MNSETILSKNWFGRAKLAVARLAEGKAGDFALLKADLMRARAKSEIEDRLHEVKTYRPTINLSQLAQLPSGTFGQTYAQWMFDNDLKPFVISNDMADIADRNTFAVRYAITHDMFHVLTGFDTSYAGEIGVLSFAVAQNYSKELETGLRIASVLYPILSFGKTKEVHAAKKRGESLGLKAEFLLNIPLEDYFEENLDELRKRLKIEVKSHC